MRSPGITVLDLFSSVKGNVNFKGLELRSQSEQLRSRSQNRFPHLSADQASVLQDGPARSTAQFWWVPSLLNSSPLGRGEV